VAVGGVPEARKGAPDAVLGFHMNVIVPDAGGGVCQLVTAAHFIFVIGPVGEPQKAGALVDGE